MSRITGEESPLPYCGSDEVAVTLRWQRNPSGALSGELVVENAGGRVCRVGGKPSLAPLGRDGEPLPAQCIVTMEMRVPTWVALPPGGRAAAGVSWAGWCGDAASGVVRVRWQHGEATVAAEGPAQPDCPEGGRPDNLSSSWFRALSP